jgi:hypothetical protein
MSDLIRPNTDGWLYLGDAPVYRGVDPNSLTYVGQYACRICGAVVPALVMNTSRTLIDKHTAWHDTPNE